MASASMSPGYYCHMCQAEVEPNLQDFTCSLCHGGFIEEVQLSNSAQQEEEPNAGAFDVLRNLFGPHNIVFAQEPDEDEVMDEDLFEGPPRRRTRHSNNQRRGNRPRSGSERIYASSGLIPTRVRVASSDNPFLLQLLSGFDTLHSDIRNYALTQGMFDNLITLLMNQLQVGPPPASDAAIAELPILELTEELVARYKTCSICFDDFQVSERCTRLPCQHLYHTTCVNTWLKQHATCPVCRMDLTGHDTSRMEDPTAARLDASGSGPSTL